MTDKMREHKLILDSWFKAGLSLGQNWSALSQNSFLKLTIQIFNDWHNLKVYRGDFYSE